jgi:hypothetical protein
LWINLWVSPSSSCNRAAVAVFSPASPRKEVSFVVFHQGLATPSIGKGWAYRNIPAGPKNCA